MKEKKNFISFIRKTEQFSLVRVVKSGLVNMIPVLIIGAFALVINQFPIKGYQNFITTFLDGFIAKLSNFVNKATFGVLSVYMTYFISRSYMKIKADQHAVDAGATIAALLSFFILAGVYLNTDGAEGVSFTADEWKRLTFGIDNMGPKSMFLAILTGLGASALYLAFDKMFRKRKRYVFSIGADRDFNRMLSTLFPIVLVALIFAFVNLIVIEIFGVDSFRSLLVKAFNALFANIPEGFFKGFFFVLLSSVLWFFGIHGSDTLESVMENDFTKKLANNITAVQVGEMPTEVLTKEFFDCFVLMGGCGATICLLIAILIFSKNRAHRGLGYTASFSMAFNINELMVFGLPIILNPIMLIPFLAVPLLCYSVSYLAIATGIVPMITSEVVWTTPIIFGGFTATGSYAGALLQIFNVILGVLIYLPFVKMMDKQAEESIKDNYAAFMDFFRENEASFANEKLTALDNVFGDFAKSLCADIKHGVNSKTVLAYQPQYDYGGKCVGVEALLRYKHDLHGTVYPPLVIKLAEEGGFLPDMEEKVLLRALADKDKVLKRFGKDVRISVNITGTTVITQRFLQFCRKLAEEGKLKDIRLCVEVTEQAALSFSEESILILKSLRKMGMTLAIDDFSMGQTSLNYLKESLFDEIKLDGSLVKGLFTHGNCREIVSSIARLANSLDLLVLAEYVETTEQREMLHEIGCDCYQGYLYSPAVFLDESK
ncbi:MAG: PTS sugar transporter subunit IIC/EAL domain-containing protein [Clostridia bacterium]|nr:PTS sugar transporter subunit IIC/EAL domain-containing protein [Clostridia bacterium]